MPPQTFSFVSNIFLSANPIHKQFLCICKLSPHLNFHRYTSGCLLGWDEVYQNCAKYLSRTENTRKYLVNHLALIFFWIFTNLSRAPKWWQISCMYSDANYFDPNTTAVHLFACTTRNPICIVSARTKFCPQGYFSPSAVERAMIACCRMNLFSPFRPNLISLLFFSITVSQTGRHLMGKPIFFKKLNHRTAGRFFAWYSFITQSSSEIRSNQYFIYLQFAPCINKVARGCVPQPYPRCFFLRDCRFFPRPLRCLCPFLIFPPFLSRYFQKHTSFSSEITWPEKFILNFRPCDFVV